MEVRAEVKRVWCSMCVEKRPPVIRPADFMVYVRATPYGLCDGGLNIDKRLTGVCAECADKLTGWQKDSIQEVNINNSDLVYRVPSV